MNLENVSPKAEPVTWATVIALALAAGVSYGFKITNELTLFLVVAVPFIAGSVVARSKVYAPDTVEDIKKGNA